MAAHQKITQDWWNGRRDAFDVYVSELVREEAAAGDAQAAERRLKIVDALPQLSISDATRRMARVLFQELHLPERAVADAVHIAVAITNGMDYMITWNCRHIANAQLRHRIDDICTAAGFEAPAICTPEELLDDTQP